jgi:predicted HicB family RNase H-like nuclease
MGHVKTQIDFMLRDIPEELHQQIKILAAMEKVPMNTFLKRLITQAIQRLAEEEK